MIHRDDTLAGELFDLSLPLRLPIADIRRREGAEGSSRPDRRFDRAVKVRADDTVRMSSLMAGEWEKKRGWERTGREGGTYARFAASGAPDSFAVTNRVPTHTADAPSISAAAMPRPS